MTRPLLAGFLLSLISTTLFAQGKDMGPAGQYYGQPKKLGAKFQFAPGPKEGGCKEVEWGTDPAGRTEFVRDEYVILERAVYLKCQDIKLTADKATYNFKTHDAVAEGHVVIDQGPVRLTGDRAVFNLDSKTGTLFNATGAMAPDMYFTGEKIEKTGDQSYRLVNGIMTSCDIDRPSWSFHLASADITLDDYAHMRGVSFRAHDIPLLYTPRLVWPTKRDRSRGFLLPRINFSDTFGTRLETAYFMPFGDSVDATASLDLSEKSYNGGGVNVRYRPSENVTQGDFDAYTVHDVEADAQQWKYSYRHAQDNLPGGFRAVVDIEDFSNLDFFRRFSRDARLHTLSQIYSSAYLTKNQPTYSLNILADRRDIVSFASIDPKEPPDRQRFEQFPSLQFRTYPNRIANTPLYFSLESSASHLRTSGLITGPEANYYRADIFPTLSLQLRTPSWLSIRPQISARQTYYSASLDEASANNPFGSNLVAVDEAVRRFYAQGQVEVVGPSFSKIFNRAVGGFARFKHVIEPRVRYLYTTEVNDQNRIIRFDTVDTPFLPIVRHSVEYSLTQRLIGREQGPNASAREVLSFSVRQSVALGNEFTNATGGNLPGTVPPGQENKFTPLTASLHANPYQSITFDASATYGNVSHQFDQTSISANLLGTGKRADKYLSFTYFASYKQPGQTFDGSSSQIRLNTGSSLLRDRIRADVQLNYDAKKGKFLEQRYLVGGTASCYGIAFEFRRYLVFIPQEDVENSFGISVSLKNVGTFGTN
ncbi:MAG: LPS assembly protein LptD [Acidobacteriota bacterium]